MSQDYLRKRIQTLKGDRDFAELVSIVGLINESKGFHAEPRTFGDEIALIHSELSEALEEYRNGHQISEIYFVEDKYGNEKPEGVPIELADAVIRMMDTAYEHDIDLYNCIILKLMYNTKRLHMHGGKKL